MKLLAVLALLLACKIQPPNDHSHVANAFSNAEDLLFTLPIESPTNLTFFDNDRLLITSADRGLEVWNGLDKSLVALVPATFQLVYGDGVLAKLDPKSGQWSFTRDLKTWTLVNFAEIKGIFPVAGSPDKAIILGSKYKGIATKLDLFMDDGTLCQELPEYERDDGEYVIAPTGDAMAFVPKKRGQNSKIEIFIEPTECEDETESFKIGTHDLQLLANRRFIILAEDHLRYGSRYLGSKHYNIPGVKAVYSSSTKLATVVPRTDGSSEISLWNLGARIYDQSLKFINDIIIGSSNPLLALHPSGKHLIVAGPRRLEIYSIKPKAASLPEKPKGDKLSYEEFDRLVKSYGSHAKPCLSAVPKSVTKSSLAWVTKGCRQGVCTSMLPMIQEFFTTDRSDSSAMQKKQDAYCENAIALHLKDFDPLDKKSPQVYGNCGEGAILYACYARQAGITQVMNCSTRNDHIFTLYKHPEKETLCFADRWAENLGYNHCGVKIADGTLVDEDGKRISVSYFGSPIAPNWFEELKCHYPIDAHISNIEGFTDVTAANWPTPGTLHSQRDLFMEQLNQFIESKAPGARVIHALKTYEQFGGYTIRMFGNEPFVAYLERILNLKVRVKKEMHGEMSGYAIALSRVEEARLKDISPELSRIVGLF